MMISDASYDYDIFLSFSIEDEEIVKPLWNHLRLGGLRVFWSNSTLKEKVGQSWFSIIQESLDRSRHFVLFCTYNSMNSNWVKEECDTFYSQYHVGSKGKRRFIPFYYRDFDTNLLPAYIKKLQSETSIEKLVKQLGGIDIDKLLEKNKKLKNENENLKTENDNLIKELILLKSDLKKETILVNEEQIGKQKTILLVDDEEGLHFVCRGELEQIGYEVHSAQNGKECIELFKEISPDLVILDIRMPDMSGIEVLTKLRSESSVPIILYSAYDDPLFDYKSWAANDFVVKSQDLTGLIEAINKYLPLK